MLMVVEYRVSISVVLRRLWVAVVGCGRSLWDDPVCGPIGATDTLLFHDTVLGMTPCAVPDGLGVTREALGRL